MKYKELKMFMSSAAFAVVLSYGVNANTIEAKAASDNSENGFNNDFSSDESGNNEAGSDSSTSSMPFS